MIYKHVRSTGLFVAAAMLLTGACGGGKTPNGATPTVNVTLAAPATDVVPRPSATPLVAGADVRLCRGEDIATSADPNGAGGSLFAFITLGNRSNTPCRISRVPDIQLLDAQGNILPVTVTPGQPCPGPMFCVFQEPLLLPPGLPRPARSVPAQPGHVVLILEWSYTDRNGASCPTQTPRATQVRMLLQGADSEVVADVTAARPEGIVQCRGNVGIAGFGPA